MEEKMKKLEDQFEEAKTEGLVDFKVSVREGVDMSEVTKEDVARKVNEMIKAPKVTHHPDMF